MGDLMDQPPHSLSTSAIHQVKSVKNMVLLFGHDDKRTGGLEGQWEDLHSSLQTCFPLAIKGLLQLNRNRRAMLLVKGIWYKPSLHSPTISSLELGFVFFFHDLSSPQVPFTVLQKQIILSSNEKQPPLGTKPTAVLWPQGNVMHWLGTDIKSADWIDWAQAVKPLYFIGRPSITTAQQTSLVHCTSLLREATLSPLKFY